MTGKREVCSLDDIKFLVDQFYQKVQENELLGPVFSTVIKNKWPQHLEKMYRFWETVLLEKQTYKGRPFPPHAKLAVHQQHFDTWLDIWQQTINEHFKGSIAEEAKWRANKMAEMFISKIAYYRDNNSTSLL